MKNDIIIYNTEDGNSRVELHLLDGTIWLSQLEIAEPTQYGAIMGKTQTNKIKFYNLDIILAIGYRVRSPRGMQFRNYASTVLKDYLIKGFAIDDERLKENGGGKYFKELLERIRDIRSSEKVFYRQVLDLFATSIDYNKNGDEAKYFFATVQNKMHYAIHHITASELVYNHVNSEKDFMGLKTFKGELPTLREAKIAKNYLSEKELKNLNNLVSGYLEFAERQAEKEIIMYMKDWIEHIDKILKAVGEDILQGNGKITNQEW